jgi:hypothetical protein
VEHGVGNLAQNRDKWQVLVNIKKRIPWNIVILEKPIVASSTQEFVPFFGAPKFRYRAHKILPLVSPLSQMNPVHGIECSGSVNIAYFLIN